MLHSFAINRSCLICVYDVCINQPTIEIERGKRKEKEPILAFAMLFHCFIVIAEKEKENCRVNAAEKKANNLHSRCIV